MLYIIAAPIGNTKDISLRSIEAIKSVKYIFAEDTRKTSRLLSDLSIDKPSIRTFHEHNENEVSKKILSYLIDDIDIGIMSDAGTPIISDPGFPLIKLCIENKIPFEVLPGASSVITALVYSGLPPSSFNFQGFFPKKSTRKDKAISIIENFEGSTIFFESPKRLKTTINFLHEKLGNNCEIAICREMTKKFQSIKRGSLKKIAQDLEHDEITCKGEIVIVVKSKRDSEKNWFLSEEEGKKFLKYLSTKDASKLIYDLYGHNKQSVYKFLSDISSILLLTLPIGEFTRR